MEIVLVLFACQLPIAASAFITYVSVCLQRYNISNENAVHISTMFIMMSI